MGVSHLLDASRQIVIMKFLAVIGMIVSSAMCEAEAEADPVLSQVQEQFLKTYVATGVTDPKTGYVYHVILYIPTFLSILIEKMEMIPSLSFLHTQFPEVVSLHSIQVTPVCLWMQRTSIWTLWTLWPRVWSLPTKTVPSLPWIWTHQRPIQPFLPGFCSTKGNLGTTN